MINFRGFYVACLRQVFGKERSFGTTRTREILIDMVEPCHVVLTVKIHEFITVVGRKNHFYLVIKIIVNYFFMPFFESLTISKNTFHSIS